MTFSMGFPSNFNLVTSPTFNPWLSISNLISSTSIPACTLLATILQILHFLWTGPLLLARVLPHTTFARSACQVLWPLFGVGLLLGGEVLRMLASIWPHLRASSSILFNFTGFPWVWACIPCSFTVTLPPCWEGDWFWACYWYQMFYGVLG